MVGVNVVGRRALDAGGSRIRAASGEYDEGLRVAWTAFATVLSTAVAAKNG